MDKAEQTRETWQERRKRIKHKWQVPFAYVEWICECLSVLLKRWAFLDILEHLGRLGILVSIVAGAYVYVSESDERRMQAENRRKANQYEAWQIINAAQGKPGNLGRTLAIKDLYTEGISLGGMDISKAYLPKLNLESANLNGANLSRANLNGANLTEAVLSDTNFSGATLIGANLTGVTMTEANLVGAMIDGVDLIEATITDANLAEAHAASVNFTRADLANANLARIWLYSAVLTEANLRGTNFAGAYFDRANLDGADLWNANLAETNLIDANLANIKGWRHIKSIRYANIYGVQKPPDGFIEWAEEHGAVSIDIRGEDEWEEWVRRKKEEEGQQEADNSTEDQKKSR